MEGKHFVECEKHREMQFQNIFFFVQKKKSNWARKKEKAKPEWNGSCCIGFARKHFHIMKNRTESFEPNRMNQRKNEWANSKREEETGNENPKRLVLSCVVEKMKDDYTRIACGYQQMRWVRLVGEASSIVGNSVARKDSWVEVDSGGITLFIIIQVFFYPHYTPLYHTHTHPTKFDIFS